MKKLLAILLSMLMLAGVFAVGVSAAPPVSTPLDVSVALNRSWAAYTFFSDYEAARRDLSAAEIAAKRAELDDALEALREDDSLNFNERRLAYHELHITFYELLLVPESLVAVDAYAFHVFMASGHGRSIPDNFDWDAFQNAWGPCIFEAVVLPLLEAGQWEQAATYLNRQTNEIVAALESLGATVHPWPEIVRETPASPAWHETLPAALQFILRWIFFGWLWM